MSRYLLRRLMLLLVTAASALTITFFLARVIPGDPAREFAGPEASAETVASIRRQLGLDRPIWEQYAIYVGEVAHGDLGTSWRLRRPVAGVLFEHLLATTTLAVAATLMQLALGLPIGLMAALRHSSWLDQALTSLSLIGLSAPAFWVGILLLYTLGFLVPLFPLGGYGGLRHLVLPALTIGIVNAPWYARMFRSSMLDVLGGDFLRTAHAKGLAGRAVLGRHALPNAIRPVVTMLGIDMGHFLGGVLVVETVFAWPGLGQLLYEAILNLDVPIIMGTVLFSSVMVAVANLLVDLSYPFFDPRVTFD